MLVVSGQCREPGPELDTHISSNSDSSPEGAVGPLSREKGSQAGEMPVSFWRWCQEAGGLGNERFCSSLCFCHVDSTFLPERVGHVNPPLGPATGPETFGTFPAAPSGLYAGPGIASW